MTCENYLLKSLSAKAVKTTKCVLNISLIRPIFKKTSYELFKGQKPNVSYFKAFGSKCFIHSNGRKILVNLVTGVKKVYLLVIPLLVRTIMFTISIPKS